MSSSGNTVPLDKMWNKNFILIILVNCCVMNSYMMLSPTFPLYVQKLGNGQAVIGFLTGVFTITAMISRPMAGKKLDSGSRRLTYLFGQIISILAISMYYFAHSTMLLLLLRLLHGIGIGITTTASNTIATDFIPKNRIAEGIGYFSLSGVLSMATAPALGIYLFQQWGFASLFIIAVCLTAIGAVLGQFIHYKNDKASFNMQSNVHIEQHEKSLFVLIEKTAIKSAIIVFLVGMSYTATSTFIALYAEEKQIHHIGLFFTIFAITVLIVRPVIGKIADKKGFHIIIVPGIILVAITMVNFYFANSLFVFLLSAIILGTGWGSVQNLLQATTISNVPPNRRGAAVSTFYLGLDMSIIADSFLGGILSGYLGYAFMYLMMVIPVSLGLVIYLTAGKNKRISANEQIFEANNK